MCLNSKKTRSRSFKRISRKQKYKKKISWKTHRSQWSWHGKYGRSKAEDCGNWPLTGPFLQRCVEMLRWLIPWRTAVTFDETTFEYVLHCSKHFLEVYFYKCLAVFFVVGQLEVTFFFLKFYYARMHGDCYMASMQWLWLEFYRKFKIFTEANVNEQTIKHSSDDGW